MPDSPGRPTAFGTLLARAARDASAPVLTDVDQDAGTRVELSVASLLNGATKAAHLLTQVSEELGRPPRLGLALGGHWQAYVLGLGCWAVGGEIVVGQHARRRDDVDATVLSLPMLGVAGSTTEPARGGPSSVGSDDWPDLVWVTRADPFATAIPDSMPFPLEDLAPALRGQPDLPPAPAPEAAVALQTPGGPCTPEQLDHLAESWAGQLVGSASRILVAADPDDPVSWAALRWAVQSDGAVVTWRGAPPEPSQVAAERIDAFAGLALPGVLDVTRLTSP